MAKAGVVVLFFGVGFLLKFAYERDMIPPELRLLAVALGAAVMYGTGRWLLDTRRLYALILQGGASGLAYLDVFFALKTYGFISPAVGFALFAALGVATTFMAVRQESRALAVLGLGGAFLAPVLASSGGGNHVMLFSYYTLLNGFILAVSWFRAWRELNLTGWLFTFVVGLFWGKANYRPELFASVEPFVLGFFAMYLVIPLLFATRQPPKLKGLVDGTLVFGTPAAVAFMQASLVKNMPYGLAWSAATGAGLYALLAAFTWRRENMRLLAQTYAALAVGLGTLAVFFAFDAYPTFAFWTIEGAAILWVGLRQDRPLARAFAMLVQIAGAGLFILEYGDIARPHWLLNDRTYGSLLIVVASLISANLLRRHAPRLREWELLFGPGMLLWAALWWSVGGVDALHRGVSPQSLPDAIALYFLASLFAAETIGKRVNWSMLRNLACLHPLVLAVVLLMQFDANQPLLDGLGWLAWPAGFAIAFWTLHRQEDDGVATAPLSRYVGLWAVLGLAATWEEAWLLRHHEHFFGMLLALAAHLAAYLRFILREQDKPHASAGSLAVLLWAMVFWFAHGYAYADAQLGNAALITAMLGFVTATALAYEFGGTFLDWPALRQAAAVLGLAMPVAVLFQLYTVPHPFAAYAWIAWSAAFGGAYLCLYRQKRDGIAIEAESRYAILWLIFAVLAVWEEVWLTREREYLYGMLLAALGHVLAVLRFVFRERSENTTRTISTAVLLGSMFFWFLHGYYYVDAQHDLPLLTAAMLGLFAASALFYEAGGSALSWPLLRQASNTLWLALPVALMPQASAATHPFASFAWLTWPAAFAVAYWSLHRHERDGIALALPAKHAGGLWLAALIAAFEISWWLTRWQFGAAWQTASWGVSAAAVLAGAVAWGNHGNWPVFAHRDIYRLPGLGPIGAFCLLWVLIANLKAPGGMTPLPYLPLLNPLDIAVGVSLFALWTWSRWLVEMPSGESLVRKLAGALGFVWLNGIALRSIHYWAGVPYDFTPLFQSVLVQSTLSLLWTTAAMALMFLARRRLERGLWIAGAALLAAVVAKLFLVDLANSGTVARIVSFMGVGGLLLVIGYLAPVPPGEKPEKANGQK